MQIVLIGAGHSNVAVLRHFAMHPLPPVQLTLVSNTTEAVYSGMLPGFVAGHYNYEHICMDLRKLCVAAGARFYHSTVLGLDRAAQLVQCDNRPDLPYDYCSINVGIRPALDAGGAAQLATPVKPIASFVAQWQNVLHHFHARAATPTGHMKEPSDGVQDDAPITHIAVVGAGAAGVELALAIAHRLQHIAPTHAPTVHLVSRSGTVLPTHAPGVQALAMQALARYGVRVHLGKAVVQQDPTHLTLEDHSTIVTRHTFWVTAARASEWLSATQLALHEGFIRIRPTLQSVSDPRVFAAGDCAHWEDAPLAKSGVYAVRMGEPLARNLRRVAQDRPPLAYRAQRHALALISLGGKHAVASRPGWSWLNRWVTGAQWWRWKNHIDHKWIRMYQNLGAGSMQPMHARGTPPMAGDAAGAMRCGGCGAKVGAQALRQALGTLMPPQNADVLVGMASADDAAVVQIPQERHLVQTVDFFRSFIDDPYRFGKIAANHALGDIYAMGARPHTATAIVTLPVMPEPLVVHTLRTMLQGAVETLNQSGCSLVGGHTAEGAELALGFAVNGLLERHSPALRKAALQAGDALVLTKPLGTGVLLASLAHALRIAGWRGQWIEAALACMEHSNATAAAIVQSHHAHACTDVTGFGLLGHLCEMLARVPDVQVCLDLAALPLLDGVLPCLKAGVQSTLAPNNLRFAQSAFPGLPAPIRVHTARLSTEEVPVHRGVLFDPQTAGGLLASLPAARAHSCVRALRDAGYHSAAIVGEVQANVASAGAPQVHAAPCG